MSKTPLILVLLLFDFGEDFTNVFGKWPSEMVSFFLNFKVLSSTKLCFSKCFCLILPKFFSTLLSNFDLSNSSILASNAT